MGICLKNEALIANSPINDDVKEVIKQKALSAPAETSQALLSDFFFPMKRAYVTRFAMRTVFPILNEIILKTRAYCCNFMAKLSRWINKNHFVFTRCQCTENIYVQVDVICVNIGVGPPIKSRRARSTCVKTAHNYLMSFVPCDFGDQSKRDISQSSEQKCKM